MLMRIAYLLGFRKKDPSLEQRFARMKARHKGAREDVDVLSHVRGDLESPWVVGGEPQTMGEIRQVFLDKYAKGVSPEVEAELVGSARSR
jgi:hypothetical protein